MVIPRQGEQSLVEIISYMGYPPPKCTCHGKQSHSSNFMNLLESLHAPNPCPKSSPTPSHMPKPNAIKISSFQNKSFLFSKTCYRVSVKYWTTLLGELLDNAPKQSWSSFEVICWTTLQGNSSENLPRNSFHKHFCFSLNFMSCTHS